MTKKKSISIKIHIFDFYILTYLQNRYATDLRKNRKIWSIYGQYCQKSVRVTIKC
jgi:hypothetical protein